MAFDSSNLHRDEKVVLDLHPHWIMLVKGVVILVITVAIGIWVLTWDLDGAAEQIVKAAAGLAIIASLLYMLQRWIAWISTNFVVTTDRCIYREGIVSKRGVEIPLERINTVFFNQSVVDRMIGAGTLTIESAGENGVQTFEDVRDPIGVQQVLYQEMEDNENRKFDRVRAPAQQMSVADEIAKLAQLHDQGHLSDAEFAAQKSRLLGDAGTPP
ncbi:MAG: PH domain-containing protein, partial [Microthrixaceae bacterium]